MFLIKENLQEKTVLKGGSRFFYLSRYLTVQQRKGGSPEKKQVLI